MLERQKATLPFSSSLTALKNELFENGLQQMSVRTWK